MLNVNVLLGGRLKSWLANTGLNGTVTGVRVGVLKGATNTERNIKDDGSGAQSVSVATYAFYNEFGTARIPARPFIRSTVEERKSQWAAILASGLRGSRLERQEKERAFRLLGRAAAADIQAKIASNMPPPNAPSTVRQKMKRITGGSAQESASHAPGTLINTGTLLKSIDYEVGEIERN